MKHVVEKVDVALSNLHMLLLLGYDIVSHHIDNETMARFENTRQHYLFSQGLKRLVLKTKSIHGMRWIPPPIWCDETLLQIDRSTLVVTSKNSS